MVSVNRPVQVFIGLVVIAAGITLGGWHFYWKSHATPVGFKLDWLDIALLAIAFVVVAFGTLVASPADTPGSLKALGDFIAKPITAWRRNGAPPTPPPPTYPPTP